MAMSRGQKRALSPLTSQVGIIKALGTSKEYSAGMLMEPKRLGVSGLESARPGL